MTAKIEDLLLTLSLGGSTVERSFDLETAFQEVDSGIQIFCHAYPSSIDYAWDSMVALVMMFKGNCLSQEHNAHHLAVDGLDWVAEYASGDPCSLNDD